MKQLIIALLLLIPLQIVSGQDKIITIRQDTIHCRIISVSSAHIQYEQKVDGYAIGKFIPTEQVVTYWRSSQPTPIHSSYQANQRLSKPGQRWSASVNAGGSYLLASTADAEKVMIDLMGVSKSQAASYYKQFKQGWNLGGNIHYQLFDFLAFGVKYSFFISSVQKDFTVKIDNYFPEYMCMEVSEKQYIHYAGPSVMFRHWLDANCRWQLTGTLSAGYVHYRDELRMDVSGNALATSKTWGTNECISVWYFPVPWLSVGANVGFMYARLTKMDVSTKETSQTVKLDKKDYENLSRLDYSLGVQFHF